MKHALFLCIAVTLLYSCSNSGTESASSDSTQVSAAEEKKTEPAIVYPYTAGYSSDFKLGDPQHAKMLLDAWKHWDEGKVMNMRSFFADSVEMIWADGTHFKKNTADSLLRFANGYRSTLKAVTSKVHGWIPLHSNDKNEDWVMIWGTEIRTSMKNKVDSSDLHEIWRVTNGKFDLVFQYEQKPPKN
ncbi:MAG: hypothetical protein SFU87_21405 [Chitinophagaceae bacterium]|nr:hypothetical protein [Chitinophagaceae bacterium]